MKFKRFLSFMLALLMVISYVPVNALATENATDNTIVSEENTSETPSETPADESEIAPIADEEVVNTEANAAAGDESEDGNAEDGESVANTNPTGTVTPAYTSGTGIWGEGGGNAAESLVVELYEGDAKIASASLNNINGIIDGDVYVTWNIPFAGSTDEYWNVTWADGYPNINMAPTKVVMVIDGTAVAENVHKWSAPDDLNKIVALAEGYTGGVVAYTSLAEAMGSFNGRKVNVLCDVSEAIEEMSGCTLTTNVEGGVTITNTVDDYIYAMDCVIGEGVTVVTSAMFFQGGENTILGRLEVDNDQFGTGAIYYQGYDAIVNVYGSVAVEGSTILRYNTNADAGLYIYGDGNDETVEFSNSYYIGAYSGTFYAEDANIETGYFLLKNSYDDSSYADVAMTLDNSSVEVVGTTDGQDSFIIDDQASLTLVNGASIEDVRDFSILSGANLTLSVDETSAIKATNMSIADDVNLGATQNEDGSWNIVKQIKGLSGEGTEASPYLINDLDELIWFRDNVNTYTSDGSNQYKGKYVKLTADIDLAGINWTPIGTNSVGDHMAFLGTFDGDGHTISNLYINADGDHLGFFARVGSYGEDVTPTVKNLKFHNVDVSSNSTSSHAGSYVGGVIANAGGNSVVSNITVTGDVYVVGYGYVGGIVGHGYPDIDNCHVAANEGSYVNAHYWCAGGIIGYAGEGGTPITNCSVSGLKIWSAYGAAAAVAGLLQDGNTVSNVSASNVEITSNSDYVMGYIAGNGEASTLTNVTATNVTAAANGNPITATDAVASVNGATYFSLQEAIDAAGEGETVTLIRDVTLSAIAYENPNGCIKVAADKNITLDLNGCTLATAESVKDDGRAHVILNYGTLTITDSAETKGAIVSNNTAGGSAAGGFAVYSEGALTLDNVVIDGNNIASYAVYVTGENATLTVDNATVSGRGAIAVYNGAEAVINSGDFSIDVATTNTRDNVVYIYNASATINGGNFDGTEAGSSQSAAVLADGASTLEIVGGNFAAKTQDVHVRGTSAAEIYGGNFTTALYEHSSTSEVAVYGGTYTYDPNDYCGEGYVSRVNADGTYGVKAANEAWILRNGAPKFYATLAEAIADAQEGETVMVAANVTVDECITIDKDITISDYGTLTVSFTGDSGITITNDAEVTLDNFNIDISGVAASGDAIFRIGDYSSNAKLNLQNVNVTGNGYSSAYAVFYVYNSSELNITGGEYNLSNDNASAGGFIKAQSAANGIVNITDAVINLTDAKIGFLDGTVTLNGVELTIKGGANAINGSALTVIGSTVTIDGADGRAITLNQGDVTIENSTLNLSNCSEGEIRFKSGLTLNVVNSTISDCTVYADASAVGTANVNGAIVTGSEDNKSQIVNGELVNPNWAAKVGENEYYATIAEAIAAAEAGETVTIMAGEYTENVSINKAITVIGETDAEGNNLVNITGEVSVSGSGITVKNLNTVDPTSKINSSGWYISGSDITIEGCDISGYNGVRYSYASGLVTFKDSKITGDVYGIHFDGSAGGEIVIEGCEITGWTSFGSTIEKVTMKDTEFLTGNYNYIRVYQDAVIEGCTFNENMQVDVASSAAGATVTVTNSSVENGEVADLFEAADIDSCTITVDGVELITPEAVINGVEYDTFAEAIAAIGDGDVVINLVADVTLDYNAREAYGTAGTTSVTINGNGYTMTLNQKDSDWSSIGLANADAKLILNDMTVEKTGYGDTSGAWNTHAINFTCPVEMNDVVINNAISVENGATLSNVTINEANGYYGLWINGNGQTVTVNGGAINATNGGRGIKIADEYVDDVASVTLNVDGTVFNTAKKAAVLVSSTAGASITASNVDITGVAEDTVNFVWVDEDWAAYYGDVTVTGGTKAQESVEDFAIVAKDAEGTVLAYYKTLDELFADYTLPSELTVELTGDVVAEDVVKTNSLKNYNFVTSVEGGVTMTFQYEDNWNYIRKASIGAGITLNAKYLVLDTDVKIAGTVNAYYPYINSANVTVEEGGILTSTSSNALQVKSGSTLTVNGTVEASTVNVWAGSSTLIVSGENASLTASWIDIWDGTPSVIVENGATLTTDAIKASRGGSITVDGATLDADSIELGHNGESAGTLTLTNNGVVDGPIVLTAVESTLTGPEGMNVTTNIADHKVVYVDGVYSVIAKDYIAQIGENKYEYLDEAVAAAEDGATITLLKDATGAGVVFENGDNVIIDLNGYTYTLNESVGSSAQYGTVGFYLWAGSNVTIKNGTIDMVADEMGDDVTFFKMFHTYGDLTLTDVTLDCANGVAYNGSTDVGFIAVESDNGTVTIDGSTSIVNAELSSETWTVTAYKNGQITIDTTGTIKGVIASYGSNASVAIKNGTFTSTNTAYAQLTNISSGVIAVSGGTFSEAVADSNCAEGFVPTSFTDGTYGVMVAADVVVAIGEMYYASLKAAAENAQDGDVITVLADHAVAEAAVISTDVAIDLNGKALTAEGVYPVIRVQNNANVTIENGSITADDYVFVLGASDASSSGYLTIKSGTYHGNVTVASVTMGELVIEGGYFSVDPYTGAGYANYNYLLNCIDANYAYGTANIVVKGGSFENFNPADNAAEGLGTNFVEYLYESVTSNGSVWNVREIAAGDSRNPIWLYAQENDETISGETWYQGYFNGMIMTVTGEGYFTVIHNDEYYWSEDGKVEIAVSSANPRMPVIFAVDGNGDYSIDFAFPEGHMENPAELVIGDNTATIEAGNSQGYYFTWTATFDGALTITMPEGGWMYTINNLTTYSYGDTQWSDSDPVVNPAIVEFAEGDELQIIVSTYDSANPWSAPVGELTFNVAEGYPAGHEQNPIFLMNQENDVTQSGEIWYQGYFSGMIMTVTGEGEFSVIYNGETYTAVDGVVEMAVASANPRMPVIFAVEGEGDYSIDFTYPVGNMMNPAQLEIGDNTATIEAGNTQGYYFTWIATDDGELTITMPDGGWMYTINNMTTYVYGDTQWSDSDPVVNPAVVAVNKGDELQIMVNGYDPADMWNTPAGDIVINAEFVAAPGTEANPIGLFAQENTVTAAGTSYDDVTYYYGYFGGMNLTVSGNGEFSVLYNGNTYTAVDGVVTIEGLAAMGRMPVNFAIDGNGEYTISAAYPVGNMQNPAQLVIGDNTATIEAGNTQGYYFTWIATDNGELTITMPEGDWMFAVNNMTTYVYGDTQWSDAEPQNPYTIVVNEGDEIQVMVNGYDPADMWNTPAGDIVFTAEFMVPVAQNTTTGVKYGSVSEALAAAQSGETVILLADTEDDLVYVRSGRTLNLNGYTLTANDVITVNGAHIVDSTRAGLLKVAEGNVVLSETNSEMAFWTGEGYKFGTYITNDTNFGEPVYENGILKYQFYTQVSGLLQSLVTDNGVTDNNLSVVIRLTWEKEDGFAYQNYVYKDDHVALVGTGDYSFTFTLENYAELDGLTLTTMIISETGVEAVGATYTINE